MSDIKLFRIGSDGVESLPGRSVALEKSLQILIERHLETLLGVRFVAAEHATGTVHGGRIDTLGIDENNCPVVIEYKKAVNENVINQGLFYLSWLVDYRGDFERLVGKRLGAEVADAVDWSAPRLLCIAGDFTKYDEHAIRRMGGNIELLRYRRYGDDLLLLELVAATTAATVAPSKTTSGTQPKVVPGPSTLKYGDGDGEDDAGDGESHVLKRLSQCSPAVQDRYDALKAFLLALGNEVQERALQKYIAFSRIRNFVRFKFRPTTGRILAYVNVEPDSITLEPGFTRDVRNIGHTGGGELEITIDSDEDLERAKPLILKSYEAS